MPWIDSGSSPAARWGRYQGSAASSYRVCVDLSGPAYRCSCPSRKVPCKHADWLLKLRNVEPAAEPDWVRAWLDERAARAARRAEPKERDEEAAARRRERRAERVAGGVAELDGWLVDQVRRGLGIFERGASPAFAAVAARMVDAQAPGLAAGLRRAGEIAGRGRDWPGRVLEELGMLHLLVSAHSRLDSLPEGLAQTVRTRLGYTVDTAGVLASGERVADRWVVLGVIDQVDERLITRRVWLRGQDTGRPALILSFAPPGAPLDDSLAPGTAVSATLAFYPAARPLRAILAERSDVGPAPVPPGAPVAAALATFAEALADDPWIDRWPIVLHDVVPARAASWSLVDTSGDALPLRPYANPWPLFAVSAGAPVTVAGEWSAAGLLPLSCWDGERPVRL
jgi:hypothetical protein